MSKDFTERATQQIGLEVEIRRLREILDQKVTKLENAYANGTSVEVEILMKDVAALRDQIGMLDPAIPTRDKDDILTQMANEMNRKLHSK